MMRRLGSVLMVIVLVLGCIALSGCLSDEPPTSSIEGLGNDSYRKCLALVDDLRSDSIDAVIGDLVNKEGDFEDYNFLEKYEELFKEIVPDEGSDEQAIKFRKCCCMVVYTEYTARKYEYYSKGFLGEIYLEDAQQYREWADRLYEKLIDAQSDDQLQAIIDFCAEKDIIYLKQ